MSMIGVGPRIATPGGTIIVNDTAINSKGPLKTGLSFINLAVRELAAWRRVTATQLFGRMRTGGGSSWNISVPAAKSATRW